MDQRKIYSSQDLAKYLKENSISPTEAINIIQKYKFKENKGDSRTTWKLWKFTLYLWLRHKEQQRGKLGNRIDTIKTLVHSDKYKRLYDTFPLPKFNAKTESKNLTQLIAEPRQDGAFKEGKYKYEGKNKIIPQGHIDELR